MRCLLLKHAFCTNLAKQSETNYDKTSQVQKCFTVNTCIIGNWLSKTQISKDTKMQHVIWNLQLRMCLTTFFLVNSPPLYNFLLPLNFSLNQQFALTIRFDLVLTNYFPRKRTECEFDWRTSLEIPGALWSFGTISSHALKFYILLHNPVLTHGKPAGVPFSNCMAFDFWFLIFFMHYKKGLWIQRENAAVKTS